MIVSSPQAQVLFRYDTSRFGVRHMDMVNFKYGTSNGQNSKTTNGKGRPSQKVL